MELCAGDGCLVTEPNFIQSRPSGGIKRRLAATIALALKRSRSRVQFTRICDLAHKLQFVLRELGVETVLTRLDRYHRPVLDDLTYVTRNQDDTLIRYEL